MSERLSPSLSGLDSQQKFSSVKDKAKKLAAWALVTVSLSGPLAAEVRAETPAPADPNATHSAEADESKTEDDFPTTVEGYTPAPENPSEMKKDDYPTAEYAIREKKLAEYKQELVEDGCVQEYINFCAGVMYAIDISDGVFDSNYVNDTEKTVLKNYVSKDEIKEFGKTGKGLDVIWDKDENGKKIPVLLYVGGSDWNVGIKQVKKAIDLYDTKKGTNGAFLKALQENEVCVFFQTENEAKGTTGRYEDGIIFFLCGKKNKEIAGSSDFIKMIRATLGVEMFGNKMTLLGGDFGDTDMAAVLKSVWMWKCCKYLYQKTHDKFYSDRVERYQMDINDYNYNLLNYTDFTVDDVLKLVDMAEKEGLVAPFVDASWEKINEVVGDVLIA